MMWQNRWVSDEISVAFGEALSLISFAVLLKWWMRGSRGIGVGFSTFRRRGARGCGSVAAPAVFLLRVAVEQPSGCIAQLPKAVGLCLAEGKFDGFPEALVVAGVALALGVHAAFEGAVAAVEGGREVRAAALAVTLVMAVAAGSHHLGVGSEETCNFGLRGTRSASVWDDHMAEIVGSLALLAGVRNGEKAVVCRSSLPQVDLLANWEPLNEQDGSKQRDQSFHLRNQC
jgi:hypothetical protein